jgi:hypothetical protein
LREDGDRITRLERTWRQLNQVSRILVENSSTFAERGLALFLMHCSKPVSKQRLRFIIPAIDWPNEMSLAGLFRKFLAGIS